MPCLGLKHLSDPAPSSAVCVCVCVRVRVTSWRNAHLQSRRGDRVQTRRTRLHQTRGISPFPSILYAADDWNIDRAAVSV